MVIAALEVDLHGRAHGGLDVDLSNVLPLLLQEGSKEVSSKLGVDLDLFGIHLDVSDSDVQAHDLLHLELDGGLDLINLFLHVIATGKQGGEFTSLGQTRTQKTRDLLDHIIRSHEEIVFLGKLLDEFLVLVELLQIFHTHVIDADTVRLFTMGGISENAALEIGTRDGRELESTRETLVTDRIVVLQGDLNLYSLGKVTLLALLVFAIEIDVLTRGKVEDVPDSLLQELRVELRHGDASSEC